MFSKRMNCICELDLPLKIVVLFYIQNIIILILFFLGYNIGKKAGKALFDKNDIIKVF
jgi:hypothetical protein